MTIQLTASERLVVAGLVRTKKSDDIKVLFAWQNLARQLFDLSPEEKEAINFRTVNGVPMFDETDPPKLYEVEISDDVKNHIIEKITDMVKRGKVSAGSDNILSVYDRLTTLEQ